MQQRQTAYKLWIANIHSSPYTKSTEEFSPNYITFNNIQITRVNLIGNVVETFVSEDKAHASVTIDDGSSTIQVKSFKDDIKIINELSLGDLIMVIGKVREYNGDIYILPEIVKKLTNLAWGKVRRLELLKYVGEPPSTVIKPIRKEMPVEDAPVLPPVQVQTIPEPSSEMSQQILSSIGKSEDGISVDNIMISLHLTREEVEKSILELLKNNDIYQNKPGHYKIL